MRLAKSSGGTELRPTSIAANQETYWKGVLSHDLEPNRAYSEVSRTAHELQRIGPHLVGLQIHNQVAILYSRDSLNAINFMPFTSSGSNERNPTSDSVQRSHDELERECSFSSWRMGRRFVME
jgi:hypothetical protein